MDNTATSRFMNMVNIPERTDYVSSSPNDVGVTGIIMRVLAVVFILMLLGINIFYYLGDTLDFTSDIMDPIYKFIGYETSDVVKQTVSTSAKGANRAIDVTANTTKGVINVTEDVVDNTFPSSDSTMSRSNNKREINAKTNVSETKLNTRPAISQDHVRASNEDDDPLVINSVASKGGSSLGFCYIGEDRGNRSCVEVDESALCMSGEIFPSRNICINPNLRE